MEIWWPLLRYITSQSIHRSFLFWRNLPPPLFLTTTKLVQFCRWCFDVVLSLSILVWFVDILAACDLSINVDTLLWLVETSLLNSTNGGDVRIQLKLNSYLCLEVNKVMKKLLFWAENSTIYRMYYSLLAISVFHKVKFFLSTRKLLVKTKLVQTNLLPVTRPNRLLCSIMLVASCYCNNFSLLHHLWTRSFLIW